MLGGIQGKIDHRGRFSFAMPSKKCPDFFLDRKKLSILMPTWKKFERGLCSMATTFQLKLMFQLLKRRGRSFSSPGFSTFFEN